MGQFEMCYAFSPGDDFIYVNHCVFHNVGPLLFLPTIFWDWKGRGITFNMSARSEQVSELSFL